MPRQSRAASKSKEAAVTPERVTRTSLRSRSRGGAAVAEMEPPKAKGRKSSPSPSPSSTTPGRGASRKSASPSPRPKGRAARSRSSKAEEPEPVSPATGRAAKGKTAKEEKPTPSPRGRRGRKTAEPEEVTEEVGEENKEEAKKEEEEKPSPARAAAKRGGRAAKSKKAVEEVAPEEVAPEEVAPEEEEKPAESPAKARGRGRLAKKSEEPAVEKSPATGRAARGRRSGAAETAESPKVETKAEEGGRSSRRRSAAADKSPEKKPVPSPKRKSPGKAEGAIGGGHKMDTEPFLVLKKLPEQTKPSPKRQSRGKAVETKVEQKESEPVATKSTRKAKLESVDAAAGPVLEKEAQKEQIIDDTEPESAAAKEPESVQMKAVPPPEVPSTAAQPASSPTKKRKRGEDSEETCSPPKKRKPVAKEAPVSVPLVEEEAMETGEPEGASIVDSSSALKQTETPVLDAVATKEAEAVPTHDETPAPQKVQSNTDMTEPPTSSHGLISSFPAETEQLTPEAEAAGADYESLPTPPEQDMAGEEPDQSDECAPALPSPMPETREAEHIHEAKEPTPVATAVPVAAPEPVQSSLEVNRKQMQPKALRKEHEPDQSSAVRPVRQAMETDLSSGSAEACSVPVQAPEVMEPVIIPERAQMLYDSSAAPSSSSSEVRVETEVQGSEAVPAKPGTGEEAMEVERTSAVPPVSSSMEADSGANSTSGRQSDVASDYVVVSMADVPSNDSAEVKQSLPQEHAAVETEPKSSTESVHVSSTHASAHGASGNPPLMNNHQDTHSNAVDVDAMNGHSTSKDLLLNRKYIQNVAIDSNTLDPAKQFSVVSYNILAECHRKRWDYSHAAEEVLEQGYRHKRLMLELKYLDGDVICLQEVDPDYYTNTLEPALRALGYSGEYKKRVDDYYHEGGATFYRSSRFSLVECSSFAFRDAVEKDLAVGALTEDEKAAVKNYMKDPSIVLLTKLKCNATGKEVTVGNIHVAYANYKHPDLQCVQIAYAVNRLVAMAGGLQNPHILCGDFNCESTWAPFQLARDGYLTNEMIEQLQAMECIELPDGQKKSLVNLFWKGFQHTSPNLQSAYSTIQAKEPTLTSITAHNRLCLDYIFCSNGDFNILGVLETPTEAELTIHSRLPSIVFPSDHVSMKARLAFK